jgi:BirA family biotin operon repressor/biotin-[acetyl-CoA-carboxylase] ligase
MLSPDICLENVIKLRNSLRTKFIGRTILWFRNVSSTQKIAVSCVESKGIQISHGTVVIADSQNDGRGRRGNKWISPNGGIWLSIILRPEISVNKYTLLPFATSIAVSEAINKSTCLHSKVKWPNDILINGKKVCGILVDMSIDSQTIQYSIVGIGLNANVSTSEISACLRDLQGFYPVTSLKEESSGVSTDRIQIIKCILEEFEKYYITLKKENNSQIIEKWKRKSEPIVSKSIQIILGSKIYTGKVLDIEPDGALLVVTDECQLERIVSADCVVRVTE